MLGIDETIEMFRMRTRLHQGLALFTYSHFHERRQTRGSILDEKATTIRKVLQHPREVQIRHFKDHSALKVIFYCFCNNSGKAVRPSALRNIGHVGDLVDGFGFE
jgi:hypothetical protein